MPVFVCLFVCVFAKDSDKRLLNGGEYDTDWDYDWNYDVYPFKMFFKLLFKFVIKNLDRTVKKLFLTSKTYINIYFNILN